MSESDLAGNSRCFLPIKRSRSWSKFTSTPKNPIQVWKDIVRNYGRVLTSRENMQLMEEKERLKAEKITLKKRES